MRTPRTTSALTKATAAAALVTATLGSALLFTLTPASAADSPYKAAVAECLATSGAGTALRECLMAVAPRRTPSAPKTESGTTASRPAVQSAGTIADEAAPEAQTSAPAAESGSGSDAWAQLRECEASGDYGLNDGSGYYGAYQFDLSTWKGLGYGGYPHQASPAVQDEAARLLQSQRGWQPWPACSRKLGLR